MFTTNPFTALTAFVSPDLMQGYIVLMALAVAIGTAFDLLYDKKLTFLLQERQRAKAAAKRCSAPRGWPPSRPKPSPTTSRLSTNSATGAEGFPTS